MLDAVDKPNPEGSTWWHLQKAEFLSTMSGEATFRLQFSIVETARFKES
jgi:hypothetical protein